MIINHSRYRPPRRKIKSFIPILLSIVFLLLISCSFSNPLALFFPTPTNTPTRTFTPSPTSTSTPTFTATATATETPTPMPPRFEVQTRSDQSTLVMDLQCGYQFALPKAWEIDPAFLDATEISLSKLVARNSSVYPALSMRISSFERKMATLELELYNHTAESLGTMEKALSQVLTTNPYGTALGTLKISNLYTGFGYTTDDGCGNDSILSTGILKSKNRIRPLVGPGYYETYEILFYCNDEVINIHFQGKVGRGYTFDGTSMQLLYTIQNSIQVK